MMPMNPADKPLLNPDDFVITRRRKQYKFALFHNSPLCYEFDEWPKQCSGVDVIEVGAGTGLFLVELAKLHPDRSYVAIDVKADRLQKGAMVAEQQGLENIQFVRARADQLRELFAAHALSEIWLTFSDPFPRERSAGRRLTHLTFLEIYGHLLRPGGKLIFKHDSTDFFDWTLEQLQAAGWVVEELSYDLHNSNLSDEYKIMTSYEQRWTGEGATIKLLVALSAA